MIFNKIIFIISFFLAVTIIYPQSIKRQTIEIIKSQFGDNLNIESIKYDIPLKIKNEIEKKTQQHFYSEVVYIFKITRSDSLISTGILDNVYGKSMPITFLVLFDIKGEIISTDIVKYREPYGGGIKIRRWNDQFKGKNPNSKFKVGEDIYSISGATISVRSVTKGIQKLILLFEKIKNKI
ncbi:MAG: hypothetical protein CO128_02140 [Ignavibacteriales bacterium CG_4_9_14_3_um_filter_30_11]|nr:MAG: hypothetical protein CO128_02140 [Ignavibacteriales bacterium CG_4_9_14_3_um_filter_30_11]